MTRSIMLSIKPEYVQKIFNGKKTIEIRKTRPKCELPVDVYIYCTKNQPILAQGWSCCEGKLSPINLANGKVIAKFTLNKVEIVNSDILYFLKTNYLNARNLYDKVDYSNKELKEVCRKSCLTIDELIKYSKCESLFCWHIDNLVKFDEYKELSEFKKPNPLFENVGMFGWAFDDEPKYIPIKKAPQSYQFVWTGEEE